MKRKVQHIILYASLCLPAFGGSISAFGQDTGGAMYEAPEPEWEHVRDRDRNLYTPGETDPVNISRGGTNHAKDSASSTSSRVFLPRAVKSAVDATRQSSNTATPSPTSGKAQKNEDDSILSFNFLYYIIQKYKLQDIVD